VFSFHATKFFNTLEGGAITTNDDALAKKIRLMKNFGFADYDQVIHIGTNGKMNEISAAMGLTLLEDLDKLVAANHRNYTHYRRELEGLPGVKMAVYDESEFCNYQYVVLEIEEEAAGLDRDTLVKLLWAENVLARRYFTPGCHRMEPYCSSDPGAGRRLPVTEWMTGRLLSLPTGTAVRLDEIGAVCAILRLAIAHAGELRQRLDQPEPQLSR
jgi:dTDP-4-amino-4,6-dideoxygalactose transaminase